jgi:hypothetical protein
VIVYTTAIGRTDPLHEPACQSGWRFVCFTDKPLRSKRWEVVKVPKSGTPSRECRRIKLRPHVAFPDAGITLWMDCNFTLLVPPERIAEEHQGEFTAFRHHKRGRIKDEAQAIIKAKKGLAGPTLDQLAAYQADGWDTDDNPQKAVHNGGFLLRRHTPTVIAHAEAWHHEVQTRTLRDQMSIDYCAQKVGLKIDTFPGNVNANRYARIKHYPTKAVDF